MIQNGRSEKLCLIIFVALGTLAVAQNPPVAEHETAANKRGHLVIIGGGLRPNNEKVYRRMIDLAGGSEKARFVILPTASSDASNSHKFRKLLQDYGVSEDRSEVLDVMEHNAATATSDPQILAKMRTATAVFLSGGDQRRLVRLLTKSDGSDTPLLSELRKLHERGGLVAGSSAGASAQSEVMLAVSGLPDRLIDEGLDTLDFGCTNDIVRRGLLITRGLGLFKVGIIDQHFYQFRGRFGRLIRATADQQVPFGFGIDENTAMIVNSDESIEIVGDGFVTVIEASGASGKDGPLGYKIDDVKFSVLSDGDRFEPRSRKFEIAIEKPRLPPIAVEYDDNFLINDIGAGGAMPFALMDGIAENLRPSVDGISIRFHGNTSHGYRFHFQKMPTSETYAGYRDQVWRYSLLNLRVDIAPIATGLKPSSDLRPTDLKGDPGGNALAAITFRGLMNCDAENCFRADEPMTRREFAVSIARSVHLVSGYPDLPTIADVKHDDADANEILRTIVAGLMQLDEEKGFRPAELIQPGDAVSALNGVAKLSAREVEPAIVEDIARLANTEKPITRGEVGRLLHKILRLP